MRHSFTLLIAVVAIALAAVSCGDETPGEPGTSTPDASTGPDGSQCADGGQACSGKCVDVTTSTEHCGGCGQSCGDGQSCVNAGCQCAGGYALCDAQCVDASNDPAHCGGCGNACTSGQYCLDANCVCQEDREMCGDACVDLGANSENCGKCENDCGEQLCSNGVCKDSCDSELEQCGQSCVDLATSSDHCGKCDAACPAGQACSDGKCKCASGQTACGDTCVDTDTALLHCGGCNQPCEGGMECQAGKCECPNGMLCGDVCVDTNNNRAHCGGCDQPCDSGQACDNGSCGCSALLTECSGECVDTDVAEQHCGGCNKPCEPGQRCTEGTCKDTSELRLVVKPENPRWIFWSNGEPFFMCGPGDPEGFLYDGTRNADGTRDGTQMVMIEKLSGTGANSIYFQAIRSHGGDGEPDHNPFIDSDPTKGLDKDILDQWQHWFTAMEAAGVVPYFFFYDDGARIWRGDEVGSEERTFIEAIVNRFEDLRLIHWVIGEEYGEAYSAKRMRNIAQVIRDADDFDHPIAVHKNNGLSFSEFADDPNIDQFAIQWNRSTVSELHDGMLTAWDNAAGKYQLNMSEAGGHGTGQTARHKNWAIAMGGAYVMALKWKITDTPVETLRDCGRLVEFMESTTFDTMAPADELASGGTTYVLAAPPNNFILYSANHGGTLGVKGIDTGSYTLEWFDPTNGARETVNATVGSSPASFEVPSSFSSEAAVFVHP